MNLLIIKIKIIQFFSEFNLTKSYFTQEKNPKNKEKSLSQHESQKKNIIKSAESNFSQFLLKDYLKSLNGGFSCLFNRLNVDSSCCGEDSKSDFSVFVQFI